MKRPKKWEKRRKMGADNQWLAENETKFSENETKFKVKKNLFFAYHRTFAAKKNV